MLLLSFISKEPVVFFKCPYVFGKRQHLFKKDQHVLMKRPTCFMNQPSWYVEHGKLVRRTSRVGSCPPLIKRVFALLLSSCHSI